MEKADTSNKSNRFFIILSLLLAGVSGYLGYQLYYYKQLLNAKTTVIEKTAVDYFSAKQDAQELTIKFNDIQSNNTQLNQQLDSTRSRLAFINQQLEKNKNDKTVINKLKAELNSIRNLIKSYLFQIDTLNTANQRLAAKNQEIEQNLNKVKTQTNQLSKEKELLSAKVEMGSKMKITNFICEGVRERGSEYSISNRARRIDKIRARFTIAENPLSKKGERTVYMVIIGPDNTIFNNGTAQSFTFKGEELLFSAKKMFEYENNSEELEMFYTKSNNFEEGKYNIKLICEESVIGEYNLELK